MRGSSFTTFLVFLPLVAIPVLAVFGIPEFQPVNASSPTEVGPGDIRIRDHTHAPEPEHAGQSQTPGKGIFQAPRDTPDRSKPADDKTGVGENPFERAIPNPYGDANANKANRNSRLQGWQVDPDRYLDKAPKSRIPAPLERNEPAKQLDDNRSQAAPFPGKILTNKKVEDSDNGNRRLANTGQPQSVQAVIDRLNRLGIRQHAIGLSTKPGEYYFRCYAPSKDGERVLRMLEFEDRSLLRAAQKVLAQVESSRVVQ